MTLPLHPAAGHAPLGPNAPRATDEPLRLRLYRITYAATDINLYEFRLPDGAQLPAFTAGAHVDLHLPNGLTRQYSLCNSQDGRDRYVVGVKKDAGSRGGSRCVHEQLRVGMTVPVGAPRNNFPLHEEAVHSVLIAGGIGITPIASMVSRLRDRGLPWELHYSARRREEAAFLEELGSQHVHLHIDEEHGGGLLDIEGIVRRAPSGAHVYCCGPTPMLDAFESAAGGHPAEHVHLERFSAPKLAGGGAFFVELAKSGRRIFVEPDESIADALRAQGIEVQTSCEQGICGTCETRVLAGRPDHRDELLSDGERAANDVMMICCSRSKDDVLVLDL
jgi:vanillate O-demethylase ferredoxin subunit